MMHRQKIKIMCDDFARRGLRKRWCTPPTYWLLWKLNIPIRPPYFQSFIQLMLFNGFVIALLLFCFSAPFYWSKSLLLPLLISIISGTISGIIIAQATRKRAKSLNLPSWKEYGESERTALPM